MVYLRVKKYKDNFEVGVFINKKSKSQYTNIITRDPEVVAQILIDLMIQGIPIKKAIKIMNRRIKKGDWIGF